VNHKSEHYRLLIKDKRCQREKQNEIEVLSSDQISVEIAQMLERFRLDGEVAVITGGGNGIGRATAAALVEAGAAVALLDRDEKAVKETETSLRAAGAEVEACILDVTDEIALETSFAGVNRRWGRLDILINNAGISIRHPTMELSLADWNNVVAVNMTGVFLGSRVAARYMLPKRKGSIVNTASIMGLGLRPSSSAPL
jgi:NAD(P)-dependent dehydrogenase (short-subunit alcohol dehydrogenase family)